MSEINTTNFYNKKKSNTESDSDASSDIASNSTDPFEDDGLFSNDPDFEPGEISVESSSIESCSFEEERETAPEPRDHIEEDCEPENAQYTSIDSDDGEWTSDTESIPDFIFDNQRAGIQMSLSDSASPIEIFFKFWTPEILEKFVICTNNYGKRLCDSKGTKTRNSRFKKYNETNVEEIKKFFGLCLLQGQIKFPRVRHLFSKSLLYYHPIFPATMSGRRFEQILRCLNYERYENKGDKLSKVQELLDALVSNCSEIYYPGESLSLDESLLLFKGRLSFRQYIKGKKAKYGIKFYELCTPDGFTLNIEVYKGKIENDKATGKTQSLVLRLMAPYLNKGHHLYMDNYYNSTKLSRTLLKCKTHSTGTLRSNRKGNPTAVTLKKLKKGEYKWQRNKGVYVSKWKDNRDVLCITTGYKPEMKLVKNRYGKAKMKPAEIEAYNLNMPGVDKCDQMTSYYSSPRKTIRWYKKVIFHLLDVAVWNASYIYQKNSNKKISQLQFREQIIISLLGLKDATSPVVLQDNLQGKNFVQHFQEKIPSAAENKPAKTTFLRCRQCYKEKVRRETSYRCKVCVDKPPLCPGICFEKWHTSESEIEDQ